MFESSVNIPLLCRFNLIPLNAYLSRMICSVNQIVLFNGFLSDFVEITSCAYTKTTILFNLGE